MTPSAVMPSRTRMPSGFTLAEVLFAMAIFTFAALVLLGTLPNGLASMREARQQAAEARIVQHLAAIYQAELDRSTPSTSTSLLSRLQQPSFFYFDANGDPVRANSDREFNTSYGARARLVPADSLPGESDVSPFIHRLDTAITTRWKQSSAYSDPDEHERRVLILTLKSPTDALIPSSGEDTEPVTDEPS